MILRIIHIKRFEKEIGRNSFGHILMTGGITICTGPEGKSKVYLSNMEIEMCLKHFADKGWFLLGNSVDNITPGGLGDYFYKELKQSPKFASHFAALMVEQGKLIYRYGSKNRIEVKVLDKGKEGY